MITPEGDRYFWDTTLAVPRTPSTILPSSSKPVARVIDVGTLENGSPFIVMEYLEGSDLAELVDAHGPLSVPTAVEYVLQACEAIAEAQRRASFTMI